MTYHPLRLQPGGLHARFSKKVCQGRLRLFCGFGPRCCVAEFTRDAGVYGSMASQCPRMHDGCIFIESPGMCSNALDRHSGKGMTVLNINATQRAMSLWLADDYEIWWLQTGIFFLRVLSSCFSGCSAYPQGVFYSSSLRQRFMGVSDIRALLWQGAFHILSTSCVMQNGKSCAFQGTPDRAVSTGTRKAREASYVPVATPGVIETVIPVPVAPHTVLLGEHIPGPGYPGLPHPCAVPSRRRSPGRRGQAVWYAFPALSKCARVLPGIEAAALPGDCA